MQSMLILQNHSYTIPYILTKNTKEKKSKKGGYHGKIKSLLMEWMILEKWTYLLCTII